jgi:hypothetical protein
VIDHSRTLCTLHIWNNLAGRLIYGSSASIATTLRTARFGVRIPAGPSLLLNRYRRSFPGVKRPGIDVDRSILSIEGVEMSRAVPLLPLYAFLVWTGTLCILPFLLRLMYADVTMLFEDRQDMRKHVEFPKFLISWIIPVFSFTVHLNYISYNTTFQKFRLLLVVKLRVFIVFYFCINDDIWK